MKTSRSWPSGPNAGDWLLLHQWLSLCLVSQQHTSACQKRSFPALSRLASARKRTPLFPPGSKTTQSLRSSGRPSSLSEYFCLWHASASSLCSGLLHSLELSAVQRWCSSYYTNFLRTKRSFLSRLPSNLKMPIILIGLRRLLLRPSLSSFSYSCINQIFRRPTWRWQRGRQPRWTPFCGVQIHSPSRVSCLLAFRAIWSSQIRRKSNSSTTLVARMYLRPTSGMTNWYSFLAILFWLQWLLQPQWLSSPPSSLGKQLDTRECNRWATAKI